MDTAKLIEAEMEGYREKIMELVNDILRKEKILMREKEREKIELYRVMIRGLSEVYEDLRRAIRAAGRSDGNGLVEGIHNVLKKIERMLRDLNIEIIYPEGERFDPRCHEAVDFEIGQKDWVVSEVVEMGFALAGQVIKPAKVKVTIRGDGVGKADRNRPWNN